MLSGWQLLCIQVWSALFCTSQGLFGEKSTITSQSGGLLFECALPPLLEIILKFAALLCWLMMALRLAKMLTDENDGALVAGTVPRAHTGEARRATQTGTLWAGPGYEAGCGGQSVTQGIYRCIKKCDI